ncbi:Pre-rRNA-processing protein ipi3 [Microbotryomycetes sp. JL221]|nr:Pre-rRNA-processing protein ipi3 [Microbotryomycetes sp. JL221]
MAGEQLQELVLSSTDCASLVPTIALHHVQTGSTVLSFKTPNQATTTSASHANGKQDGTTDSSTLKHMPLPKTTAVVQGERGCGGVVVGIGGKHGRSGINVWTFVKEAVAQKKIPPVRLSTITISPGSAYFAGGTHDGRIFLWEFSSGTLLLTIDAHYRAISVLEFTQDDAALVSGSEDGGVSVWSVGKLLNANPMNPPTPFATLTDHTLPITSLAVGAGAFPACRILSASMDSTCKLWDISNSAPALLSTFSFSNPVTHIVWDSLERFFFAAGPTQTNDTTSSRVVKVSLYRKRKDAFGYEAVEAVGGGGRGDVERLTEEHTYEITDTITAMHLSRHSPLLVLGTASTQIHLLALPSLVSTRIIPAPPSSTPIGPITFVETLLRPSEIGSNSTLATTSGRGVLPARPVMVDGMGRTARNPIEWIKGGQQGRTVEMRVGVAPDVQELINPAQGLNELNSALLFANKVGGGLRDNTGTMTGVESDKDKCDKMEQEVFKLRGQLGKAVALNDSMWKKIVENTLA